MESKITISVSGLEFLSDTRIVRKKAKNKFNFLSGAQFVRVETKNTFNNLFGTRIIGDTYLSDKWRVREEILPVRSLRPSMLQALNRCDGSCFLE